MTEERTIITIKAGEVPVVKSEGDTLKALGFSEEEEKALFKKVLDVMEPINDFSEGTALLSSSLTVKETALLLAQGVKGCWSAAYAMKRMEEKDGKR